ncbi:unnamed protein product [Phytomonas sp. Hart1]|nr:unnamed protein product [Phytomonas sp. Hart1]|eukprot:CCW72122.1 unnamed protein product [Phytomonas sp. isolate Hart1]
MLAQASNEVQDPSASELSTNPNVEGEVTVVPNPVNPLEEDPSEEVLLSPEPNRRNRRLHELPTVPPTIEMNILPEFGPINEVEEENADTARRPGGISIDTHVVRAQQMHYSKVAESKAAKAKDPTETKRRLMQNFRSLQKTINSGVSVGISAHPINGDLFHWRAVISGPENTPWEGGLFKLDLTFTDEYPMEPPKVRFLTKDIFHPNVYMDGNICLDILRGFWSPTLDLESLLVSIISLLSDPNPSSAANCEAARMLLENKQMYESRVRSLVDQSLEQSFSDIDDESAGL